ncbi:MAG: thiamine diphosphokinase [Clostridia bacterium]|jgi:thiamine pyrophosphokinase|nr:thiamine diphosphokinase [Clostridia bacterium]
MRCLIFAGGEFRDPRWHCKQVKDDDFVLCADKGAEYVLSMGLIPGLVVGDLDSLDHAARQRLEEMGVPFLNFPGEKDETDTELALIEALRRKPEEIIIFAGSGDRLDHTLANIFLLIDHLSSGIPIRLATPGQTLWVTDHSVTVAGYPGQTVSLIALSSTVSGLTLKGFYYPLDDAVLRQGSPRGISNIMLGHEARIQFTEGILLIVQTHSK